jgi:hypothetical protein
VTRGASLYQRLLTIAGTGHAAFALAASGEDPVMRGRAISLLGQIEALPRLVMTAVPQCEPQSLIHALAENLLRFIDEGAARSTVWADVGADWRSIDMLGKIPIDTRAFAAID